MSYKDRGCRDNNALFQCLLKWYREDLAHVSKWRKAAREDFDFYNGDQWNASDQAILSSEKRPTMTFNRIAPLINAIVGSERNNKREVRFIPRRQGVAQASDILTSAAEWFRDEARAEYADSEAFRDMVVCGMGWTDTTLDYEDDIEGLPCVRYLDPLSMLWDSHATELNLGNARRLWYVQKKPIEVARELFPDVDKSDLHADWAETGVSPTESDVGVYSDSDDGTDIDARKIVTLVECRWFAKQRYVRAIDFEAEMSKAREALEGVAQQTGEMPQVEESEIVQQVLSNPDPQLRDYTKEEFAALCEMIGYVPDAVEYNKRVVKRAFLGRKILEISTPMVPDGQLGWECITGYYSKTDRHFYGIVRPTKDAQRWSNKFFSQIMHILNSQAKGGILAEHGVFENDQEAARSFNRADSITFVTRGALAQNQIQPKPKAEFPSGFFQLFTEAKETIHQVTGLSLEFMGTREVNQAGILEAQRRQSSLNLLACLFDALRLYRQRQGKIILHLLQNELSDGRLVRIISEDNISYVPLIKESITNAKYDIIVDDAPTSPNEKERTFNNLVQLLPMFKDLLTPDILVDLMQYSPLPTSLVEKIRGKVQQQMVQQATVDSGGVEQQLKLQQMAQKGALNQADLALKQQQLFGTPQQ